MSDLSFRAMLTEGRKRSEPPVYKPFRLLSPAVSLLCIQLGIPPNVITGLGFVAVAAGALQFAAGDILAGSGLVLLSYLLDCVDGETARWGRKASPIGGQLDHLVSWLSIGLLQYGATAGAARHINDPGIWQYGFAGLVGWYGFYHLALQISVVGPPEHQSGLLRAWCRILFRLMPLDSNLLLLFAVFSNLPAYVRASGIVGPGLLLSLIVLYTWRRAPSYPDNLTRPVSPISSS